MTNKKEIYKCEICGNIVEVLHDGSGELVCCGQPMKLQEENSVDASSEKHIPIIKGDVVVVGKINHPMEEKHYIEWIEVRNEKQTAKIFLKPGDKPQARSSFKPPFVRAYCNLHGLWKGKE